MASWLGDEEIRYIFLFERIEKISLVISQGRYTKFLFDNFQRINQVNILHLEFLYFTM